MSKFSTTIPTTVDELLQALPRGAILNRLRLSDDQRSIVLEWEHDDFRTPYTGAIEVAPTCLTGKQPWPACVKQRVPKAAATAGAASGTSEVKKPVPRVSKK